MRQTSDQTRAILARQTQGGVAAASGEPRPLASRDAAAEVMALLPPGALELSDAARWPCASAAAAWRRRRRSRRAVADAPPLTRRSARRYQLALRRAEDKYVGASDPKLQDRAALLRGMRERGARGGGGGGAR